MALSWSMDKTGPMTRSVEDCALIFSAIYGPDGRDAVVVDAPLSGILTSRRAIYGLDMWRRRSRKGTDADRAVLDVLRAQGITLYPIALPDDDLDPLFLILYAEAAAAFDELTRSNQTICSPGRTRKPGLMVSERHVSSQRSSTFRRIAFARW